MMNAAAAVPSQPPGPTVQPMPLANTHGPGRDRRFSLPQFFVNVNGIRTAFADQGHGSPVLFIHGLAGNVAHWVEVAPAFVKRHRVLAIDLPGHGETDRTGRYRIDGYVEHVVAFLDALGIAQVSVVGHSMGGMVSLGLAIAHPARIRSATLVNPAGMARLPAALRLPGHLALRRRFLDFLLPKVWKHGILSNVFFEDNEYTRAFIRMVETTHDMGHAEREVKGISMLMDQLRPDLLERDYGSLLESIQQPIGVIWGEKDRLVPARLLHAAAKRLANVAVDEIPRCGHMPNIEQPARVIRFIEKMLERG